MINFNANNETGLEIVKRVPVFVIMNDPIDSTNRFLKRFYWKIEKFASKNEFLGFILYPIELFLLVFIKEGPSTEIMVCKKIN